jgi:hypothetical protein
MLIHWRAANMNANPHTASVVSKRVLWTSRVLWGLAVLFLVMDGVMHVVQPAPVVQAMKQLGFPLGVTLAIGVIELVCTVLYVIPGTSILGAVLLTGYVGGAVAAHLRVGNPPFEAYIFPVIVGALVWGGVFPRIKVLLGAS